MIWQLQEAKAKLTEFVNQAKVEPQVISRHGKPEIIAMSLETYNKIIGGKSDLVSFFRSSPLCNLELDLQRDKDQGRDINL